MFWLILVVVLFVGWMTCFIYKPNLLAGVFVILMVITAYGAKSLENDKEIKTLLTTQEQCIDK